MAAHRKIQQRRVYLCAGGLRKGASSCSVGNLDFNGKHVSAAPQCVGLDRLESSNLDKLAKFWGNSGHENDTPIILHRSCIPLRHHFADSASGRSATGRMLPIRKHCLGPGCLLNLTTRTDTPASDVSAV